MVDLNYNSGIPLAGDNPSTSQGQMFTNFGSIGSWVSQDHFGFGTGNDGTHQEVTFPVPLGSDPAASGNISVLYTKVIAGLPQLFFKNNQGVLEITGDKAGQVIVGAQGSVSLFGGIYLKWGSNAAISNGATQNFVSPFPNNCWSVQVTINIGSTVSPVGTNGFNVNGFTFRTTAGGGVPISYIAIGN